PDMWLLQQAEQVAQAPAVESHEPADREPAAAADTPPAVTATTTRAALPRTSTTVPDGIQPSIFNPYSGAVGLDSLCAGPLGTLQMSCALMTQPSRPLLGLST